MISNEQLSAFMDGELPPEEMDRVRRAVQDDELLAARLRKFEQVDSMVAGFAAGIDSEPLPRALRERLDMDGTQPARAASTAGSPVDSVHGHPGRRSRNWRLPVALAASLLVAVLAGMRIGSRDSTGDRFDTLVAVGQVPVASSLAQALEHVASDHSQVADPQSGLRITPQLSFVSAREGVCREFRLDAAERAARGLACRNEGGWRTLRVTAAAVRSGGGDGFETASIDGDTGFDAFVDALIDTAPLGPEEETRLMQNGWRPD